MEKDPVTHAHEARLLNLDCSQALIELHWKPVWKIDKVFEMTTLWYKSYIRSKAVMSSIQINQYIDDAKKQNLTWTNDK